MVKTKETYNYRSLVLLCLQYILLVSAFRNFRDLQIGEYKNLKKELRNWNARIKNIRIKKIKDQKISRAYLDT